MGQLHCIYNCMERGFQYLTLCLWVWKFLLRCRNYRIWLQVCSIPRCLNIFSRKVQRSSLEWTLLPSVFQQLSDYLQVYIDLCASCWNAKLQTFVSPVSDLQCWSVFGLSISWDGMIAYTFLPVILLPQVLTRLWELTDKMLVVTPVRWEVWMMDLINLSPKVHKIFIVHSLQDLPDI